MADRGKTGEDENTKIWKSRERNELFGWNKKCFSLFLKDYHLVKNKNLIKIADINFKEYKVNRILPLASLMVSTTSTTMMIASLALVIKLSLTSPHRSDEARWTHVEHLNGKNREKTDTQRCKLSKEVINFFIIYINKTTKHNRKDMILQDKDLLRPGYK